MFANYYNPHPELTQYVESICIMGHCFNSSDALSSLYTFMPTHTRFLCFYLEDRVKIKKQDTDFEQKSRCVIIGPQLTPVTMDLGKEHISITVALKPCGLYRLLGIPLKQIVDCDFDASLVIGKEITELIEKLLNTLCTDKRNLLIQNYLLAKLAMLKPALPIDKAMLQLVKSNGNLSVDILASQACVSVRQFERQSLDRIGLPPKYFARMIRFSEAYKFKERNPQVAWTEISHLFGYYDQMHLIKDFRHFAGTNPSVYKEDYFLNSVKFNSLDI